MKTVRIFLTLLTTVAMNLSTPAQTNSLKANEVHIEMSYEDGLVNIEWSTQKEVNSSYFLVEKSTDSSHYSAVKMVSAAGNSGFARKYQFTDTEIPVDKVYYRVTLFTMNGQRTASVAVPTTIINIGNLAGKYPPPCFQVYLILPVCGDLSQAVLLHLCSRHLKQKRMMICSKRKTKNLNNTYHENINHHL